MFKWVIDAVRGPDYEKNVEKLILCFGGKANIKDVQMSASSETMKIYVVDKKNISYPLIKEYKLGEVVVVEEDLLRIKIKRRQIFDTFETLQAALAK